MDIDTFEQYYEQIFQVSGGEVSSLDEIIWINNQLTPLFEKIMAFTPVTEQEKNRRAELLSTLKTQMALLYATTLSFLLVTDIENTWQDENYC